MDQTQAAEVQRVFALQQQHRWKLAQSSARERVARLERLREAIVARRDAIAEAMHKDFRKPAAEVELTELHPTLAELKHAVDHLEAWMKPEKVATPLTLLGSRSEIRSEARGVVLILAPWNYPFFLLVSPLIAAIAAGNAVMLKPSEKTKHTGRVLKELIAAVFEEREVALFEGDHSLSDALVELPFDHLFFTGSTSIGKKIMAAAAKHLTSVTLELGGKSPALIDETADVKLAAERVVFGKFINAGQTCVAPDHVLVHRSQERPFLEAAKAVLARFYGATEAERAQTPDFARLVDDKAFARLRGLLDAAVAAGGVLEAGGGANAAERYLAPTIVSGVRADSPLMEEEIFGPVLPVVAFETRAEALTILRRGGKPLALYVFAEEDEAEDWLRDTTAGGTCVNNTIVHLANPDLPFGGVGASGMGNYHGLHGFRTFSHQRAVLVQQRGGLVKFLYPPYGGKLRGLAAAATKLLE